MGALLSDLGEAPLGEAVARVRILETWPADPRVARTLAQLVEAQPFPQSSLNWLWPLVFRLLSALADVRTVDPLRAAAKAPRAKAATLRAWLSAQLPDLAGELGRKCAKQKKPDPADVEVLERLLARLPAVPVAVAASAEKQAKDFEEAIAKDPADDQLRQVFADWLLEKGDARGEFIQLQFKQASGQATGKDVARAARLQKQHAADWLGDAGLALGRCEFERGFLVSCALGKKTAPEWVWPTLVGHRVLATVRELEVEAGPVDQTCAIVGHPVLRLLEALSIRRDELQAVYGRKEPWNLERLTCTDYSLDGFLNDAGRLGRSASLPRLRSLAVRTSWADQRSLRRWASFLSGEGGKLPLEEIALVLTTTPSVDVRELGAWLGNLPHSRPRLQALRVEIPGLEARVRRTADGAELTTQGTPALARRLREGVPDEIPTTSNE